MMVVRGQQLQSDPYDTTHWLNVDICSTHTAGIMTRNMLHCLREQQSRPSSSLSRQDCLLMGSTRNLQRDGGLS